MPDHHLTVVDGLDPILVKKPQAAELLGVCPRTIDELMHNGLPYVRIGRRVLFRVKALDEWAEKQEERE